MSEANVKKISKKRIILLSCLALVGAILLTVIGYVVYVFADYKRIEDNESLQVLSGNDADAPVGEELKIITYNIGFAAYTPEFSFFMAIPTMLGASAIKMLKFLLSGVGITGQEIGILLVGCVVSFIVSLLVIKALMDYVRRQSFSAFGIYRIVLGVLVLAYFLIF